MTINQVLSGHYSPETAYQVDDYPYGFKLRCKKRWWLEVNKNGTRLMSQTTNPKKSFEMWNTPKASTYSVMGAMYLDENNYVQWSGLSIYDASKAKEFLETFSAGLTDAQKEFCTKLAEAYERKKAQEND